MLNKGWSDMGKARRFAESESYRPWGQVRRRNLLARLRYILLMTILGVLSIAVIAVMAIFAASVLLIATGVCLLAALTTFVLRYLARVPVKARAGTEPQKANGIFVARKVGNTWITY